MSEFVKTIVSVIAWLFLIFGIAGCKSVENQDLIKQTGTTALSLAAAGFSGSFDAYVNPEAKFYLIEGVGSDFGGSHLSAHGQMNPASVDVEKLEKIIGLLERMAVIPEPAGGATVGE